MKILALLLALVATPLVVHAQDEDAPAGARIAAAQVSGFDVDRLSPGLRRDIDGLIGQPLDLQEVAGLAKRIEAERPGVTTSFRAIRDGDGDARVIFFVARIEPYRRSQSNINSRYTIERVVLDGVPDSSLSQSLRDDLQALTSTTLERANARRLSARLRSELVGYEIQRKISRGSRPGQIVLTFEVRKSESMRWVHFEPSQSKFLFHQKEGYSGLLDIPISGGNVRVTPRFAFDNGDDLVEEYSGGGLRVETRMVGSERLGIGFEASRYQPQWRTATLTALAGLPGPSRAYDRRTSVAPWVTFAFTPRVRVSAGIDVTDLRLESQPQSSEKASVFTAGISYDQRWRRGDTSREVETSASLRSSGEGLGTDFDYTRLSWDGSYRYRWQEHTMVTASARAGHISGEAPLFERFTLGDSTTLRGWDKYEIAPAGGDSMFHLSVEYRYRGLAFFSDMGSVWDETTPSRVRAASGVGFHFDNFFATYGVALNGPTLGGAFMIGVRF